MAGYELWIDDVLSIDSIPGTTSCSTPSTPLLEGYHDWYVNALDGLGNVTQSIETWTIVCDLNPPAGFDLVSPENGAIITNNLPAFTWDGSSDAGAGLERYDLYINGTINRENIDPTTTSIQPISVLDDGTYTWLVKAVDLSGKVTSSSSTRSFVVDTTPSVKPILDAVATPTNVSNQSLTGTKEANSSIWLNGVEVVSINAGATWSYVMNLEEGDNPISILSKDAATNESGVVTSSITLDTQPPTSPLISIEKAGRSQYCSA